MSMNEDYAAVIREHIDTGHYGYCQMVGRGACTCGQTERLAAVAALDALLAERDAAREDTQKLWDSVEREVLAHRTTAARAEAAEATLTRYRDALEQIEDDRHLPARIRAIARAALDGPKEESE